MAASKTTPTWLMFARNGSRQKAIAGRSRRTDLMRTTKGSVLAEGVVALMLIIGGTVAGTLLLVNMGCATYYKEKLGFIDNQAAIFAANRANIGTSDADVQTQTQTFVNDLLNSMGMPPSQDITVTVDPDKVVVATKLVNLSAIGNGTVLPATVSVQDTSVYKRDRAFYPVVVDCNTGGATGRLYLAAYCAQGLPGATIVGVKPLKQYGRVFASSGFLTVTPSGIASPTP